MSDLPAAVPDGRGSPSSLVSSDETVRERPTQRCQSWCNHSLGFFLFSDSRIHQDIFCKRRQQQVLEKVNQIVVWNQRKGVRIFSQSLKARAEPLSNELLLLLQMCRSNSRARQDVGVGDIFKRRLCLRPEARCPPTLATRDRTDEPGKTLVLKYNPVRLKMTPWNPAEPSVVPLRGDRKLKICSSARFSSTVRLCPGIQTDNSTITDPLLWPSPSWGRPRRAASEPGRFLNSWLMSVWASCFYSHLHPQQAMEPRRTIQ